MAEPLGKRWHASGVGQELTHLGGLLAVLTVLGSVSGDSVGKAQFATVNQHESCEGGHRLGHRKGAHDGVFPPRRRSGGVEMSTPEIDDVLALQRCREARANIAAVGEVALEALAQCAKPFIAPPVDFHRRTPFGQSQASFVLGGTRVQIRLQCGDFVGNAFLAR